ALEFPDKQESIPEKVTFTDEFGMNYSFNTKDIAAVRMLRQRNRSKPSWELRIVGTNVKTTRMIFGGKPERCAWRHRLIEIGFTIGAVDYLPALPPQFE